METKEKLEKDLKEAKDFALQFHNERTKLFNENTELKADLKTLQNKLDNTEYELKKYKLRYG